MSYEYHMNHYVSSRGPADVPLALSVPSGLRLELYGLSMAYKEPIRSLLLRLYEEFADSHREEAMVGAQMRTARRRGSYRSTRSG